MTVEAELPSTAELGALAAVRGWRRYPSYKDSGIPWLGDVPAHWSVERFKSSLNGVEQGWCPPSETRPAEPGEWAILKAGASNGGIFRPDEHKALAPNVEPLAR